jgi:hypothetical protein
MRPWTNAPVVQLIALPGPPIICQMCGRPVRTAIWTPSARLCPCGANLDQPPGAEARSGA